MKKIFFSIIPLFFLLSTFQIGVPVVFSAPPTLFFSDLTWGPKTGWEGSATKGAAVTVWGKNFGSTRGSSYITVNGTQLLNNADYAEWDVIGPARGLERITFWLNSNCQNGDGAITVTVGGVTSNALPFTVTTGTIYFISVSNGSNSNNGLYSSPQGGSNGPFKDIYMFNPGLDSAHGSGNRNPSGDGQYIVYIRAGTYTTTDVDSAFVALRGPYGGPTKQKALIAYPGETPTINTTNASRGIIWNADYSPYGMNSYFTYSKLYGTGGTNGIDHFGNYNRTIGCHFKDYLTSAWTGVVWVGGSKYTRIYGNYFNHNGYDSYKHNIYIKTQPSISGMDYSVQYTYVGWNEIANPVAGSDNRGGAIFISKASDSAYDTRYVYIHNNYFHGGNEEFIYTGDNTTLYDIYIYNNIFTGGSGGSGAVYLAWDTNSVFLYNNTFYNTHPGRPLISVTGATHATLKNNIYYALPGQTIFDVETYRGGTLVSDHELFSTSVPSGSGITVTNAITGDPLFVSPGSGNFHLQSNSPAINAGTSNVSSVVTLDYDNITRPQGSLYDMGAYEYITGGDVTPPAPPGNLRLLP